LGEAIDEILAAVKLLKAEMEYKINKMGRENKI